ncbi:cation:proton antiporter domain-containing protein [Kineococcus indalonis]|uniref:cation:proton antiporter domain-containing protein n=1 Tax=Kineococcus indalonis TaxID=2696566 RepID=UPI0014126F15|nr:sodium:proton antiporter [Kineococcus indalonis]NAZ88070.1 sodium:proton antiporter [Kineococcus indalonis]
MEIALALVGMTVVVCAVAAACDRFGWPTPLVMLATGAVVSFAPGVPEFTLTPELVLNGLLPPLLYATTAQASLYDFRRDKLATFLMSVVLVVFSTVVIGAATSWLLPGVALAACMALGAVVAPPDAVAAAAIGQRLGLPRRVATLLEEESLVNDATALIALSVAVTALTESVSPVHVGGEFALAVLGAVLIGAVVAAVLLAVRRRVHDPVLDTALSFAAPYLAFLPAEALHVSGVLATVVTGLAMAHRAPRVQTASARIAEATNWRTVQFLLEGAVFLLIGLQLPHLLRDAAADDLGTGRAVLVCAGVLVAAVLSRFAFLHAVWLLLRFGPATWRGRAWSPQVTVLVSWAGMRGVVTLAAAQLLPADVPHRPVLLLAAFTVVAGTLLVQGSTLPWLVRRVGAPGPDPAADALQAAELVDAAGAAGLRRLEEVLSGTAPGQVPGTAPADVPEEVRERLRARAQARSLAAWERLGRPLAERTTPSAQYAALRLQMLAAERDVVVEARDTGRAAPPVLRSALAAIDLEESLLEHAGEVRALHPDRALAPAQRADTCEHLRAAPDGGGFSRASAAACEDCLREGTAWVHLRTCLGCGHVGCCDSSPRRHARAHAAADAHPVVVSAEPGEAWRWCFVDERMG